MKKIFVFFIPLATLALFLFSSFPGVAAVSEVAANEMAAVARTYVDATTTAYNNYSAAQQQASAAYSAAANLASAASAYESAFAATGDAGFGASAAAARAASNNAYAAAGNLQVSANSLYSTYSNALTRQQEYAAQISASSAPVYSDAVAQAATIGVSMPAQSQIGGSYSVTGSGSGYSGDSGRTVANYSSGSSGTKTGNELGELHIESKNCNMGGILGPMNIGVDIAVRSNDSGGDYSAEDVAYSGNALYCGEPGNQVTISGVSGLYELSPMVEPEQEGNDGSDRGNIIASGIVLKIIMTPLGPLIIDWSWIYKWWHVTMYKPEGAYSVVLAHTSRRVCIWHVARTCGAEGAPYQVVDAPTGSPFPRTLSVHINGYWYGKRPSPHSGQFSKYSGTQPGEIDDTNVNYAAYVPLEAGLGKTYNLYYPRGAMAMKPSKFLLGSGSFVKGMRYPTSPAQIKWDATVFTF